MNKNFVIEYVDGVKHTTYTKLLKPKKAEKTFSAATNKYSIWGAGRNKSFINEKIDATKM